MHPIGPVGVEGGSNGSKSAQISHFQLQPGSQKVATVSLAYVLIVKRLRSGCRRRFGPPRASKCAPAVPSWGPVESAFGTISWVQNSEVAFLLQGTALATSRTAVLGMQRGARGELIMDL